MYLRGKLGLHSFVRQPKAPCINTPLTLKWASNVFRREWHIHDRKSQDLKRCGARDTKHTHNVSPLSLRIWRSASVFLGAAQPHPVGAGQTAGRLSGGTTDSRSFLCCSQRPMTVPTASHDNSSPFSFSSSFWDQAQDVAWIVTRQMAWF